MENKQDFSLRIQQKNWNFPTSDEGKYKSSGCGGHIRYNVKK
jgi:hypothetical protein